MYVASFYANYYTSMYNKFVSIRLLLFLFPPFFNKNSITDGHYRRIPIKFNFTFSIYVDHNMRG